MKRAGIVLALVLTLLMGVLSSRGQQRGRALRSAVVYPAQRVALRMNHAHPAHVRLRCVRCHQDVMASDQSRDLLIPEEASCNPCHAQQTRSLEDSGESSRREDCAFCHVGAQGRHVPASSFPAPRLNFSHRRHAQRGASCLSCHEGVQQAALATRSHLPTMRSCFQCHGPDGDGSASGACDQCHVVQPDGRLQTEFPEGSMLPPQWLHGMDHDRDFLVRHRWIAADQGAVCAQCHQERECVACHDGRGQVRRVHRGDFLTTHAPMARRDEPRCSSCHTTQRFCTECHSRLGLATVSSPSSAAGRRFHPPTSMWVNDPQGHAAEARRSMTQCSSCHVERDCVACHGAVGIGTGISPHPPGFATQCASTLRRNPRACITCHGDVDTLCR